MLIYFKCNTSACSESTHCDLQYSAKVLGIPLFASHVNVNI